MPHGLAQVRVGTLPTMQVFPVARMSPLIRVLTLLLLPLPLLFLGLGLVGRPAAPVLVPTGALVAGIYLWDRYKRAAPGRREASGPAADQSERWRRRCTP